MRPDHLPRPIRLGVYALAVAVVLYVTLSPLEALPPPSGLSDKFEHMLTWGILTLLGLALSPRRLWQVPAFTVALGALIEVLQAILPFNRSGDWRDFVADALGVAVAFALWQAARRAIEA
jgi:VanZ family protein